MQASLLFSPTMNRNLWLLAICQGLFLTNNVTFIAINGLVGLSLAPLGWMATLPVISNKDISFSPSSSPLAGRGTILRMVEGALHSNIMPAENPLRQPCGLPPPHEWGGIFTLRPSLFRKLPSGLGQREHAFGHGLRR